MRVVKPGRDNIFVRFHHCNSSRRTDSVTQLGYPARKAVTLTHFKYLTIIGIMHGTGRGRAAEGDDVARDSGGKATIRHR